MRRTVFIIALICLSFQTVNAQALKIGLVNSEAVIQIYPEFRRADEQLAREMESWKTERTVWEKDMEKLAGSIQQKEQSFAAGQNTFSESKKKTLRAEIDSLSAVFQDRYTNQSTMEQERLNNRRNELFSVVLESVNESIQELGEQNGYDLIIDSAGGTIVYARDWEDITDQLLRVLEEK